MASTFFVRKISPGKPFLIGRGTDVDFELRDASVSRHHAQIEKLGAKWIFKNLSQTSGTLFEGSPIDEKEIFDGDVFLLGLQQLRFSLKDGELALSHVRSIENVPAISLSAESPVILGRKNSDEDLGGILHPAAPKILAAAKLKGERLELAFRHKKIFLEPFSTLKLPWCLLEFRNGNLFLHQKDVGFSLAVKNLSATISQKKILDGIHFSLPAGKILSIIGESGQGKTTFLRILAGKIRKSSGEILLDGLPSENRSLQREIAYLPQEPELRESLTVMETLKLSARLSLPKDYTAAETELRAKKNLSFLGISGLENSRIAELSGGERRRVAIADQLMGAPGLILLDEPLSGLDPMNAKRLCAHLKNLAAKGHTIVLTTHSYEALQVSDAVLLIHRGQMGFYGTPADAFRYFNAEDPEGILEALSEKTPANWKDSGLGQNVETPEPAPSFFPKVRHPSVFASFVPVLFRQWFRDRGKALSLIVQPLLIGALLSQIFSKNSSLWVAAFALILCANWFALSLSVREIVQEKSRLLDELRKGTSPVPILFAKWIFTSGFALFETLIVYALIAPRIGVFPSASLCLILLSTIVPATSAGLLLSTLAKNSGQANAFLPLIILPQIALSGVLVPTDQTTAVAQFLSKIVWTSYDQSALQSLFTGSPFGAKDLWVPLLIGALIYIISTFALYLMKKAK